MRIVTYNIHGWLTADREPNWSGILETLQRLDADIIGLNEVFHPHHISRHEEPALTALAMELGMNVVFGPCIRWPAQDDMPENAYGNALLSRYPILASAAHHLTPKEKHLTAAVEGKEERGLLEARLLLDDGSSLTVYVTHLDHTSEEARVAQLRTARTWISRDRNRPHAVIGDFNAISLWDWDEQGLDYLRALPENRGGNLSGSEQGPLVVNQMQKAGYEDLYTRFGHPKQRTYLPPEDKNIRIDYIFVNQMLAERSIDCAIWEDTAGEAPSDHAPVWADFA